MKEVGNSFSNMLVYTMQSRASTLDSIHGKLHGIKRPLVMQLTYLEQAVAGVSVVVIGHFVCCSSARVLYQANPCAKDEDVRRECL